jgi:hypothetical protein
MASRCSRAAIGPSAAPSMIGPGTAFGIAGSPPEDDDIEAEVVLEREVDIVDPETWDMSVAMDMLK